MKPKDQRIEAAVPAPEAADLMIRAAQLGIETAEYIGIHVLRSAYGCLHPSVVAFERDRLGQVGNGKERGRDE